MKNGVLRTIDLFRPNNLISILIFNVAKLNKVMHDFIILSGWKKITWCFCESWNGGLAPTQILRDLSEISRGEGRWKTGEGYSFLSPLKGRVMTKMTGTEGGSQKNKPPRSWSDASILCFTRIQTIYENRNMQLFPDIQFNLH